MDASNRYRLPFTPPRPQEAAALAHAAAYLKRAASELQSRQLTPFGRVGAAALEGDLPALLSSAGFLCETVLEMAPTAPARAKRIGANITNVRDSV
jgi:hypothetical protein